MHLGADELTPFVLHGSGGALVAASNSSDSMSVKFRRMYTITNTKPEVMEALLPDLLHFSAKAHHALTSSRTAICNTHRCGPGQASGGAVTHQHSIHLPCQYCFKPI